MIGRHATQPGGFKAFVPEPFPPKISLTPSVSFLLEAANISLGRLDGATELLPRLDFFILLYVRREAALSSQDEGTRATIVDSLKAEADMIAGLPDDVNDILRYTMAMNQGLSKLDSFPLSVRLVREVHQTLMEKGGRSDGNAYPGEIRRTQNWISGSSPATARFVPPPPDLVPAALSDVEKFIHSKVRLPVLVKAALAHAQFETIHPFVDDNGRTGRMLVTFYLYTERAIQRPILYLSEYFKRHRDTYFDRLHTYHEQANVNDWLEFFLNRIKEIADDAIRTVRGINALRERDLPLFAALGRNQEVAMTLLHHLYGSPLATVRTVQTDESVEYGRTFIYQDYLKLFTS